MEWNIQWFWHDLALTEIVHPYVNTSIFAVCSALGYVPAAIGGLYVLMSGKSKEALHRNLAVVKDDKEKQQEMQL